MIIRDPGERHIAVFDVHVPHQNPLNQVIGFAHDTGCDHFILGGDFLNLEWASHWNEAIFGEMGGGKLREMLYQEIDAGEKVIAEIRKAIGKKAVLWYIPGNHESWLWYAVWNHKFIPVPISLDPKKIHFKSDVADLMNIGLGQLLHNLLHASKYNMQVLDYMEILRIGKIAYFHGHQFTGQNPLNSSMRKYPHLNVAFGHHHTEKRDTIFNGSDPRDVHQHTVVPALCGLCPGYLRDKSTRWLNGFWVADIQDNLFDGRVVKVFDGKIIRRSA